MNKNLSFWYDWLIMANESIWLTNLFKKLGYKYLFIKSFYKTDNGKVWDDADLRGASHVRPYALVRLCDSISEESFDGFYIYADKNNDMPSALVEIQFPFKHAGTICIPLEKLTNSIFDDLCKSIFIQLMMLVSKGWAIQLGAYGQHFIEPYTEDASLVECDISIE